VNTIHLSDAQLKVVQTALKAMTRAGLGQFDYMLEEFFPAKCYKIGTDIKDLARPLKQELFPEYPNNGGPGISLAAKETQIAYEVEGVITQYLHLKNNGGWFDWTTGSNSPLGLSGEKLPVIDGHEELTYKDYTIPEEHQQLCLDLFRSTEYTKIRAIIGSMNIPNNDGLEIMEGATDDGFCGHPYIFVRVHKPRNNKETTF